MQLGIGAWVAGVDWGTCLYSCRPQMFVSQTESLHTVVVGVYGIGDWCFVL